jgi:hypothetical protein
MLKIVQRYIFDKTLEPLDNDALIARVQSYDHLFTHAGIPTARLDDIYAEAMRTHGQYQLKVDDFLRAWERIKPGEGSGVDLRPINERGQECSFCGGVGRAKKFIPKDVYHPDEGEEIEIECPVRCKPTTTLARRTVIDQGVQ